MKRPIDRLYDSWLEAERRGDGDAADEALAALFQGLPDEEPSPGFAARTLARARAVDALAPAVDPSAERSPVPLAARLAAVWLAGLSLATLMASSYLVTALPRLDLGVGLRWIIRAVAETWQWLASGIVFWGRLTEYGTLIGKLVQVPEVSVFLLASLMLSIVAFRLLQAILRDEGKLTYAQQRN